jgi:hypothetical protein
MLDDYVAVASRNSTRELNQNASPEKPEKTIRQKLVAKNDKAQPLTD